jgi:hypothetical protein
LEIWTKVQSVVLRLTSIVRPTATVIVCPSDEAPSFIRPDEPSGEELILAVSPAEGTGDFDTGEGAVAVVSHAASMRLAIIADASPEPILAMRLHAEDFCTGAVMAFLSWSPVGTAVGRARELTASDV